MSDTPMEINDHLSFIARASGRVLVTGLGLGMVLNALLCRREVTHLTVVEKSAEVVALVAPHYRARWGAERLEIVEADAFTYRAPRGVRYDMAWHDIWPTLSSDNLPEMRRLHAHYRARATVQESWGHDLCRWARRNFL